ncbi:NAD(P)-binding protein [Xylariaceae sp. FL0662B]|nr:NAD(P)-binding protein [Xylariaceae sp. FL0662B]
MAIGTAPRVFLVFGNGYIATQIKELLQASGKTVITAKARTENREQVLSELITHKPTHVINCAGVRGVPNADWCEDHKIETYRSNVLGVFNVVDCCFQQRIHVTHFGSACIYDRPPAQLTTCAPFTEEEEPFYGGSTYSRSRLLSELSIRHYPNLLLLRIRVPIAADLHPGNMIPRLFKFEKLLNLPGSGTVLPNLLPAAILLADNSETGIYNLVNPQPFTNNEIMELAKQYIRPDLKWVNFELEDMQKILKAPRCNAVVDSSKLVRKCKELGYEIKDTHVALEEVFIDMKAKGL